MKWFLFSFIFFHTVLFASSDLLPISTKGRIRPLGSSKEKNLNIIPSKRDPMEWLDISYFEKEKNPSQFSNESWNALSTIYKEKGINEAFIDLYLKNYEPLTKQTYYLSQNVDLTYPSIAQLKAELFYSRWPLISFALIGYLVALAILLTSIPSLRMIGFSLLGVSFLIHGLALFLRSYILERPPVSNMAETIIYVPWIGLVVSFIFSKKLKSILPLNVGLLLAIILLAILEWTSGTPALENVQPVLNSRLWLTIHVLMIVASYGIFIFAGLMAHVYLMGGLFHKKLIAVEQSLIKILYLGVSLLIPGTLLGGVWAAQSWGRFWDWDPKESWAFISACFYLLIIHAYQFKKIETFGLAIGGIIGLLAISFTWYGVNYILGTGLHSYGFGAGGEWLYYSYLALEGFFLLLCLKQLKFPQKI